MKVVFSSTSAEDLYRFRLPVARRLKDAGYIVLFAGPDGEYAEQVEQQDIVYHRIASFSNTSSVSATSSPVRDLVAGFALARVYRRERPDIVHHFTLHGVIRGAIAARLAGLTWVVHSLPPLSRSAGNPFLGRVRRTTLRFLLREAELVCRTRADRQLLLTREIVHPEQTHVIPGSGIDLDVHRATEEPNRTPVAAMIGPLRDALAVETFVGAARRLHETGVRARFALVQSRSGTPSATRAQLKAWQEEGVVEWWGLRQDAAHIFRVVHVPCLFEDSLEERLNALEEAAAAGRPLVTLDDPGVRSLLREGEAGHAVDPYDAASLAASLEPLLTDADLRRRMGQKARHVVETERSADHVARQIMGVYERLFLKGREV